MSRTQVTLLAVAGTLGGAAALAYVLATVPPYTPDHQLSATALLYFFGALFLVTAGAGALVALALHQRWPALAGRRRSGRPGQRQPSDGAVRQGILFGVTVVTLTALSILRILDITFALVTLLLVGLVEAYAQTRR